MALKMIACVSIMRSLYFSAAILFLVKSGRSLLPTGHGLATFLGLRRSPDQLPPCSLRSLNPNLGALGSGMEVSNCKFLRHEKSFEQVFLIVPDLLLDSHSFAGVAALDATGG